MRLLVLIFFLLFSYVSAQKTLTVVTRNAPTTFYYGTDNQPWGFEYDLVNQFAKEKDLKINWVIKSTVDEVLETLRKGQAHIAAAGLTKTAPRSNEFIIGPTYFNINEKVICAEKKFPKTIKDLEEYSIEVIKSSSYIETLKTLKKDYPKLKWSVSEDMTTEDIFQMLEDKKMDCTIADSHIASINIRYYPRLNVRFSIAKDKELTWMLPKSKRSKYLNLELIKWFQDFKRTSKYAHIVDKHFSHVKIFNYYDVITYHKRIETRLPKYLNTFKKYAKEYDIPWKLLVAQSYQESHWNPRAKSPTGVRGMMMITLPTAKSLGVTNRLDFRQSIKGGAKYYRQLLDIIPKEVTSKDDRYKFALAAYNVGLGHLYDAIRLGKRHDINPYIWLNMKNLLPLLSKPKYYKTLKYGYARGLEPVKYVTRINNYYQILNNKMKE